MSGTDNYEYRLIGCGGGVWRVTEWGDRKKMLQDHVKATGNWAAIGIERRLAGDDTTIERKKPGDGDWTPLTEDMINVKAEQVSSE